MSNVECNVVRDLMPLCIDGAASEESRKVVVFDATAPHVMDPVYPGVCEEILNFGEFWNADELKDNKEEIIALTDKNKALHRISRRKACFN